MFPRGVTGGYLFRLRLQGSEGIGTTTGSPAKQQTLIDPTRRSSEAQPGCDREEVNNAQGGGEEHVYQGLALKTCFGNYQQMTYDMTNQA